MPSFPDIVQQLQDISVQRAGRYELASAAEILCAKYDLEGDAPADGLGHPGEQPGTWVFDGTVPEDDVWAALARRGEFHQD